MYDFKEEFGRKEKIYKLYLNAFIITVIVYTFIDFFGLGIEKISMYRIAINVVVYVVIYYFALRRKRWAVFMIKLNVWLNILLLVLIITVKILGL
jgi:hypothetical protein